MLTISMNISLTHKGTFHQLYRTMTQLKSSFLLYYTAKTRLEYCIWYKPARSDHDIFTKERFKLMISLTVYDQWDRHVEFTVLVVSDNLVAAGILLRDLVDVECHNVHCILLSYFSFIASLQILDHKLVVGPVELFTNRWGPINFPYMMGFN